jgi:hypothetical protein
VTERLDDRDLERTLSDIGTRLDGPKRDLWPAVRTRIVERRAQPWWSRFQLDQRALAPVAATLAIILVAAFLLTPDLAARAAQVLGFPGVQIYQVPQTPTARPTAPALTFAGQRVETAPVRVTIVYGSVKGIPLSPQAGVSAIVVEFKGTLETQIMSKAIGPGTTLDAVPLGSGVAYYLAGQPHQFFFRDPAWNIQPETLRLAGNTLLWQEGGVTYRLEAQVALEEAVRIASSLR